MNIVRKIRKCFPSSSSEINYNYYKSRQQFIQSAINNNASIIESLLLNKLDDLTIDIAVFKGNNNSLILHISGTHGVEGFIGSEIQNSILQNYRNKYKENTPTVIFVHGLNPFGMKYLRRVNENNVDLNRNALFSDEERNSDYNKCLYEKINNIINPKYPYSNIILSKLYRLYKMGVSIYKNGFENSKRSMITGTYDNKYEKGLFYGGNELQKSHKLLKKYLEDNNYLQNTKNFSIIDVHSGMGERGKDTIMLSSSNTYDEYFLSNLFKESYDICYTHSNQTNNVTKGYDLTCGDVADNYPKLFKNAVNVISITQEFGTYHNILVALELIVENQCWYYGSKYGNYDNKNLYRIFSPLHLEKFKHEIIERGEILFDKIINHHISLE
jgi:hypothetical protein